jgi:hypothetical protein
MLVKAHQPPASRFAWRIGRSVAVVLLLCVPCAALTTSAEASATAGVTGTLRAVAPATTQELSATTATTVQRVAGATAAPPTSSPTTSEPHSAPTEQAAPASGVAVAASPSSPVPEQPRSIGVGTLVRAARERVAVAVQMPHGEGRETVGAIVHAATTVAGGGVQIEPVAGAVQQASRSRTGELTHALTRVVVRAASPSSTVHTVAGYASALTATVTHARLHGAAIERPTRSGTGPRSASRQTIEPKLLAPAATAAQAASGLVWSSPRARAEQSAALARFLAAAPLAPPGFDRWSTWSQTPRAGVWTSVAAGRSSPIVPFPQRGQSAVSPPAQGAHSALPPAGPAPTPSPGGVSQPATVGASAGTGASIALTLAALLMLAAPLALRRLRLDDESWRLAPFALIADRPG